MDCIRKIKAGDKIVCHFSSDLSWVLRNNTPARKYEHTVTFPVTGIAREVYASGTIRLIIIIGSNIFYDYFQSAPASSQFSYEMRMVNEKFIHRIIKNRNL